MLDVCLLGTGGMMPLPYRWLTSLMARYNGTSILIDCGEGTQIAMKEKGWSPKPIDIMCFTHYHADHISGLPGMLLTMGNAERTEPLLMIGPKGLTRVVNALRVIAPELPFPIECMEITEPEQEFVFDMPSEEEILEQARAQVPLTKTVTKNLTEIEIFVALHRFFYVVTGVNWSIPSIGFLPDNH